MENRETSTGDTDSEAHVPSQLPAEDTSTAKQQEEVNSNGFKFQAYYSGWYTMLQPHIQQRFSTPLFLAS